MEEFSLEDLTAQLQAVQEKKSTVRLSERNVVELVNKLKELGFLDRSLLHTTNGKEYITQKQLRTEIDEIVRVNGGRISLAELSSGLNVDWTHCERESTIVIEQSNGHVRCIQEELITEDYFDGIALEINERLEAVGMLRIGELAMQYGLSQELLLSVVSSRLGSILKGELLNSMLYTQAYMERLEAQLRGALIGTTAPIQFSTLLKSLHLEETGTTQLLQKLAENLLARSQIKEVRQKVKDLAEGLAKESFLRSKQKAQKAQNTETPAETTTTTVSKPDDNDTETDKGKGKKSKGKSKQRSKSKQPGTPVPSGKQGKEAELMSMCPTQSSLMENLITWYPEIEEIDQLAESLSEKLLPDTVAGYQRAIEEVVRLTDKRRQEMKEAAGKGMESTVVRFWLFSKGIDALGTDVDEATVVLLQKHLVKTTGYDSLDWMLRFIQLQEPGADEDVPDPMIPITPTERSKLVGDVPTDIRSAVDAILQNLKQEDPTVQSILGGGSSLGHDG